MESDGCIDSSKAFPIFTPTLASSAIIPDGNLLSNNDVIGSNNDVSFN